MPRSREESISFSHSYFDHTALVASGVAVAKARQKRYRLHQTIRRRKWTVPATVTFDPLVVVSADGGTKTYRGMNEIGPIPKGCEITFTLANAHKLPTGATVNWMVRNSGREAENENDLGHRVGGRAQHKEGFRLSRRPFHGRGRETQWLVNWFKADTGPDQRSWHTSSQPSATGLDQATLKISMSVKVLF